jgi:hypothetical protein
MTKKSVKKNIPIQNKGSKEIRFSEPFPSSSSMHSLRFFSDAGSSISPNAFLRVEIT